MPDYNKTIQRGGNYLIEEQLQFQKLSKKNEPLLLISIYFLIRFCFFYKEFLIQLHQIKEHISKCSIQSLKTSDTTSFKNNSLWKGFAKFLIAVFLLTFVRPFFKNPLFEYIPINSFWVLILVFANYFNSYPRMKNFVKHVFSETGLICWRSFSLQHGRRVNCSTFTSK